MTRVLGWIAATLFLALVAPGCSSRGQRDEDFLTPEDTARKALETYFTAWTGGEFAQVLPGTDPPVMVVDDTRLKKRTLRVYKVLGAVPADAPLCFAVELSLDNPRAEIRERYVVVGRDPVWVWRYDDYLMITHWCEPMPEDGKASSRPKKR